MKRNRILLLLVLSLLLTGCGWLDGSYVSITPHQEQRQLPQTAVISAKDYLELTDALTNMIAAGTESAAINVAEYPGDAVESGMAVAVRYAMENDPIGAYAVEEITYELGASAGQPAVAVSIRYRHSRSEIRRIRRLESMEEAEEQIRKALTGCEAGVVMLVADYSTRDFTQLVENMAKESPQTIMETPQVSAGVYGSGRERVVEVNFTYQTGRDALRQMQSQVRPVFEAASLYVSGDGSQWQKFSQLYAFLMERFDYKLETSITPAYSLLHHGVGDSRAFATVYAAMCRAAGLECGIVTGTRSGEPWTWNMVYDNGYYYHVDLLRSSAANRFQELTDAQMHGYVWDYSAYPVCTGAPAVEETEDPAEAESAGAEETAGTVPPTEPVTEPVETAEENF